MENKNKFNPESTILSAESTQQSLPAPSAARQAGAIRTPQSIDILIAEDSPLQAEILRRILSRAGYSAAIARDGREALQTLREHLFDLVMSDINMPEIDGFELCRTIKLDEKLSDIPVILVTTLYEPKDIINAIASGADDYITKPYIEANLLTRISSLLKQPATRKLAEERRRIHLEYASHDYDIATDSQRMAPLLLSLYESVMKLNRELTNAHDQLNALNEYLEKKVIERTEALQVSEEKFRAIFEEASDGIALADENGIIVDCNREFERQTGRKLEQLRQIRIWELHPGNQVDLARRIFRKTWQEAEVQASDLGFLKPGGEPVPIDVRSRAITIAGKRYLQSITRDITERLLNESRLAEQFGELQRWNDVMVDREMRNIELKHEVNELLREIGQPPRYPAVEQFGDERAV